MGGHELRWRLGHKKNAEAPGTLLSTTAATASNRVPCHLDRRADGSESLLEPGALLEDDCPIAAEHCRSAGSNDVLEVCNELCEPRRRAHTVCEVARSQPRQGVAHDLHPLEIEVRPIGAHVDGERFAPEHRIEHQRLGQVTGLSVGADRPRPRTRRVECPTPTDDAVAGLARRPNGTSSAGEVGRQRHAHPHNVGIDFVRGSSGASPPASRTSEMDHPPPVGGHQFGGHPRRQRVQLPLRTHHHHRPRVLLRLEPHRQRRRQDRLRDERRRALLRNSAVAAQPSAHPHRAATAPAIE